MDQVSWGKGKDHEPPWSPQETFPTRSLEQGQENRARRVCVRVLSRFSQVLLFSTPLTVAHQAPLSMKTSWQEYWSGFFTAEPLGKPKNSL